MLRGVILFLVSLFILIQTGCGVIKPSWLREENASVVAQENEDTIPGVDGPVGGHFEGDEWVPNKPEIAVTYKMPDLGASFIVDFADIKDVKVMPALHVELFEIDSHIPYLGVVKLDAGVSYMRTFLYVGKLWTNIFEISTGIYGGWNFENKEPSFGIAATIIRF